MRLPPGFADEGIRAAIAARAAHPELATLILSQYVEQVYTAELLDSPGGGIGYLLKERVSEVADFTDSLRRVAAGGTAMDRRSSPNWSGRARAPAVSSTPSPHGSARPSG